MTTKIINFDWAIKNMLRDKANFDILEGFLSALLKKDIEIIELLESESNNHENLKFNRVDLMVSSENEQFIIEVQNSRETDYLERILFGASKVIIENLKLGEAYKNIKKVVSVNIIYFNLGSGEDYIYHGKTDFYGINTKDKLKVLKKIFINDKKFVFKERNIFPEYFLIRVEKFKEIIGSDIDEWVHLFKNSEIDDDFKAKGMDAVRKKLNYLNMDEKSRKQHDRYLMDLVRERDIVETAEERGERRGVKKALEKAQKDIDKAQKEKEKIQKALIDTAKLLLSLNTPLEIISKNTQLSIKEIEKLKD